MSLIVLNMLTLIACFRLFYYHKFLVCNLPIGSVCLLSLLENHFLLWFLIFFFFFSWELTFNKGKFHAPWLVKIFVQSSFVFSYDGHDSGFIGLQPSIVLISSSLRLLGSWLRRGLSVLVPNHEWTLLQSWPLNAGLWLFGSISRSTPCWATRESAHKWQDGSLAMYSSSFLVSGNFFPLYSLFLILSSLVLFQKTLLHFLQHFYAVSDKGYWRLC